MFVDHSARESVSMLIGDALLAAQMRPPAPPHGRARAARQRASRDRPHGLYPCAAEDSAVAIVCRDDAQWAALVAVAGLPLGADPRFATGLSRWKRRTALDAALGAWTQTQAAEALAARLQAAGVAASVSRSGRELYGLAAVPGPRRSRDRRRRRSGRRLVVPPPWRMSRTPASIPGPAPRSAPTTTAPCGSCWATTPRASPRWRRAAPWSDSRERSLRESLPE